MIVELEHGHSLDNCNLGKIEIRPFLKGPVDKLLCVFRNFHDNANIFDNFCKSFL